jgi:hypothetical protein
MEKHNNILAHFGGKISGIYGVHHIEDEFLMIDNLSNDPVIKETDSIFLRYPIKTNNNIVYFCVKGSLKIKINLTEYQIRANDTLTILAGCVMELLDTTEDAQIAVISFSNKYFTPFDHMEEFMGIGNMIYNNPLIHLSEDTMQECIEIYLKMKAKLQQEKNPFRIFAIKAYSYVLCSTALEQLVRKPVEKISNSDRPMDLYNRFMELLQKDFRQHRTIRYYAQELNISPKYFSTLIKKVSGKTAGEWIDEYVMLEARALLKCRRYTIQQISDMLSFPNQSFFAKYFKAHAGYTPSQYQTSTD